MECENCNATCVKFGRHRNGLRRYRCKGCKRTFTETHAAPLGGMYTSLDDAARAIELLTEGCSVATVERITGLHRKTILSLLVVIGEKCERMLENRVRSLPVSDVQCDEMWGFVGWKRPPPLRLLYKLNGKCEGYNGTGSPFDGPVPNPPV